MIKRLSEGWLRTAGYWSIVEGCQYIITAQKAEIGPRDSYLARKANLPPGPRQENWPPAPLGPRIQKLKSLRYLKEQAPSGTELRGPHPDPGSVSDFIFFIK